jgi:hypothetical protein
VAAWSVIRRRIDDRRRRRLVQRRFRRIVVLVIATLWLSIGLIVNRDIRRLEYHVYRPRAGRDPDGF